METKKNNSKNFSEFNDWKIYFDEVTSVVQSLVQSDG